MEIYFSIFCNTNNKPREYKVKYIMKKRPFILRLSLKKLQ